MFHAAIDLKHLSFFALERSGRKCLINVHPVNLVISFAAQFAFFVPA